MQNDVARMSTEELMPLVYDQLRQLAVRRMAGLRPGQTLQPTALVNDVYVRLCRRDGRDSETEARTPQWDTEAHFYVAAAKQLRNILVDEFRRKGRGVHGGHLMRIDAGVLEDVAAKCQTADGEEGVDLLALDAALKELEASSPRQAEVVELRFFAGLPIPQVAQVLEIDARTVNRDWTRAKAKLFSYMRPPDDEEESGSGAESEDGR